MNSNATSSVKAESFSYFLVSTIVVAVTIVAFLSLSWSTFGKYYAFGHNVDDATSELAAAGDVMYRDNDLEEELLNNLRIVSNDTSTNTLKNMNDLSFLTPKSRARRRAQLQNQSILNSPVFQSSTSSSPIDHTDIVACTTRGSDEEYTSLSTCTLISYIWKHALSVCLTFVVTLSVFPGITSDIRSQNNPNNIRCPTDCSRIPYGGKYSSEGAAREWSTVVIVIVIFIS